VVMDIVFAGPRDGDARLAAALARGEPPRCWRPRAWRGARPRWSWPPQPGGAARAAGAWACPGRLAWPDGWTAPADALLGRAAGAGQPGPGVGGPGRDGCCARCRCCTACRARSCPAWRWPHGCADGQREWLLAHGELQAGARGAGRRMSWAACGCACRWRVERRACPGSG
jgi:hypothetical protein